MSACVICLISKKYLEMVVAAEVIGKDPSAWFKTVIIDKGKATG